MKCEHDSAHGPDMRFHVIIVGGGIGGLCLTRAFGRPASVLPCTKKGQNAPIRNGCRVTKSTSARAAPERSRSACRLRSGTLLPQMHGASPWSAFGRPPKLTTHQRQEGFQRLAAGETQADIARTY